MAKVDVYFKQNLGDEALKIAMGVYPGVTHVNKFGSVVNVSGGVTEDIWDGGGTYVFPVSTADMTHVSQTTDQVAARGSTWEVDGLTTDYVQVVQEVDLDGTDTTTPVALGTPLFRVNRMYLKTPDLTLTSTVRLHNAAETIDYTDIQIDHNQTMNAIYTIPAGMTGYITRVEANHIPQASKDPNSVHYHILARRNAQSGAWRAIQSFGTAIGNGSYRRDYYPYKTLPEKTDIRCNGLPDAADAHMHASFDLILVEDN